MQRKKIILLCGGKSAEHEVSIMSARSVYRIIDKEKYSVSIVGIDKSGKWQSLESDFLENTTNKRITTKDTKQEKEDPSKNVSSFALVANEGLHEKTVVFPLLHGTFGEDGSIQGLLKMMNVPFVGSDILGSSISMDKDIAKRLLKEANISICKFITIKKGENKIDFENASKALGETLFVKPANCGSSIGVSRVSSKEEFDSALQKAFKHDTKVLIEEYVDGREIEVAVLGNTDPKVSVCGEIRPTKEFYDYEAKYMSDSKTDIIIPADIPDDLSQKIKSLALSTFKALEAKGMARVDFFLTKDNHIYVNEINTIPGFAELSVYPLLWKASGVTYKQLIDELIELSLEDHT